MSNTSDDRPSNSVPSENEARLFVGPHCPTNHRASSSFGTLFQGQSTEGESDVNEQKRKASDMDQIKDTVGKKNKMTGKTFPSEVSKQASENNSKGALIKFEVLRRKFVPKIVGPPTPTTNQVNLQGQIQASSTRANQESLPAAAAATTNQPVIDSFDELCGDTFFPDDALDALLDSELPNGEEMDSEGFPEKKDKAIDDITVLQAENKRLRRESRDLKAGNRELKEKNGRLREQLKKIEIDMSPASLQKIIEELKKNETKGKKGYKFPDDKVARSLSVLQSGYSSIPELVANLLMCHVTMNRK